MIIYICKLVNFNKDEFLSNLPNNISLVDVGKNIIKCNISIDNFERKFTICLNSNFLFIFTNKKSEKRKIFKNLYSIFSENISYFNPSFDEEQKFLKSLNDISLKFIHENKIVYNNKLTDMYFKNKLDDDYFLFEAKIYLNSNFKDFFLYYGDAIKIKDKFNDNLEYILTFFEKKWVGA